MTVDLSKYAVPPEVLRWECPLELLSANSDETMPDLPVIGQDRAMKSLRLGLSINKPGFNIFVSGYPGTGRHTAVRYLIEKQNQTNGVLNDWCYVYNFKNIPVPQYLSFKAGLGKIFQREMDEFIGQFNRKVTTLLQGDFFLNSQKKIFESFEKFKTEKLAEFEKRSVQHGLKLELTQTGAYTKFSLVSVSDGKSVNLDAPEVARSDQLEKSENQLNLVNQLSGVLQGIRDAEKNMRQKLIDLQQKLISPLLLQPLNELKQKYSNQRVNDYLDDVQTALLQKLEKSVYDEDSQRTEDSRLTPDDLRKYHVNLILDNSGRNQPPVIFEEIPSLINLFGTIERSTSRKPPDFLNIRSGSLLAANGGYLVINLSNAANLNALWRRLKQALATNQIGIEPNSGQTEAPFMTLRPEPIPLNLKIILIGEDHHYYHLLYNDDDFPNLFKIRADFDTRVSRSNQVIQQFAGFFQKLNQQEKLQPFHPSGLAAIIEEAVRHSGSQTKISTHLQLLSDLVHEANYWAETDQTSQIERSHVETAIREQIQRRNLVEERVHERYIDGTTLINLTGSEIGQINSLVVREDGEHEFGKPNRITVRTSMGRSGIVNIDRDSDLSGRNHNKGVSILKGFFRGTYAQDKEINLSASICFEQSYSRIDGDSASAAELYALLSSITQVPIRQDIAVTGSINQFGEIQPVGGVNEKIEGFFQICHQVGLTGKQGVIIPTRNLLDLQLRPEIIRAVAAGDFHIYSITHVDDGLEIMTGIPAGEKDDEGNYPEGTFHFLIDEALHELNRKDKESND